MALACWGTAQADDISRIPDEDDFANVPIVLTASRLKQPLNEAPGAVTVIDRRTIHMSGARTLAEVLRLVPGYMASGWNGANPVAAYHVPLDDYGSRNLVLIDGRPVYSSLSVGDTHRGMMDVMLEDIERIEVLRGANSAAYGANAMFGVVNIITRHSADAPKGEVSVTMGNNGIQDRRIQLGTTQGPVSARLSVGEQRDEGYLNAHDDRKLSLLDLRLDIKPNALDDILLEAGVNYLDAGDGFANETMNPLRTVRSRDSYLNTQWRRQLSGADELQLSANHAEEWKRDVAPFAPLPAVMIDYSGIGYRNNLELQYKSTIGQTLRGVVGAGYKEERARSDVLFSTTGAESFHEERVFGTLEWRVTPEWLLNGGLFLGQHSLAGGYAAPRFMVNWLISPEHTLRAGVTNSVRAPSLFEYAGDMRYDLNGMLLARTWKARGQVEPERVQSQEIGYQGRFPSNQVTVDMRAYRECMSTIIRNTVYTTSQTLPYSGNQLKDFTNAPGFELVGIEGQLRWKPIDAGELWLNQSFEHLIWQDEYYNLTQERQPPAHATTVAWFQHLPGGVEFTLIHQFMGSMSWRDNRDWLPVSRRTDVRLAYPFKVQTTRAEVSFTYQSIEGDRPAFLTRYDFKAPRRGFVQFRMEL
jgi:iron complex outermembrane receptor protein